MPLVLSRRIGEKLVLTIDPGADPQQALRALLEEGIEISAEGFDTKRGQVSIGIRAPWEVRVLRGELVENDDSLKQCGNGRLDRDSDGAPCESLCN